MGQIQQKHRGIMVNGLNGGYDGYREQVFRMADIVADVRDNLDEECPDWLHKTVTYIRHWRTYMYWGAEWAGQWNPTPKVLKINLVGINEEYANVKSIVYHEMAHAWYDRNYTPRENNHAMYEKVEEFKNAILADKHAVDEYSAKKIKTWSNELFANEIHSILTQFQYDGGHKDFVSRFDETSNRVDSYWKAYYKLHDLK